MNNISVQDNSGDKDNFTIIPNYILNHSSANDQALYLQMKRLAGDNGKCFAGVRYFMKQLNVGQTAIKNSIDYLTKHRWIDYIGKTEINTKGGIQLANTYKINNIWKMNADHFQGVSETDHLSQGVSEKVSRCIQKGLQGVSESVHTNIYNTKINTKIDITPKKEMELFLTSKEYYNNIIDKWTNKLGADRDFVEGQIQRFYNHWIELTKDGKKQRWQKQPTFELNRRLFIWFNNQKQWSSEKLKPKGRVTGSLI